jgi:hypothetical protein
MLERDIKGRFVAPSKKPSPSQRPPARSNGKLFDLSSEAARESTSPRLSEPQPEIAGGPAKTNNPVRRFKSAVAASCGREQICAIIACLVEILLLNGVRIGMEQILFYYDQWSVASAAPHIFSQMVSTSPNGQVTMSVNGDKAERPIGTNRKRAGRR